MQVGFNCLLSHKEMMLLMWLIHFRVYVNIPQQIAMKCGFSWIYRIRCGNLIWWINLFWVIGGFYIGECYCILHALGNKKENLAVFNLADFHNSPNCQNKFYAKFSSYMEYHKYYYSFKFLWYQYNKILSALVLWLKDIL